MLRISVNLAALMMLKSSWICTAAWFCGLSESLIMLLHPHLYLHFPTEPKDILTYPKPPSVCPHIVFLIHYQWGCSGKCRLITSHTGLRSFWSFWGNLSCLYILIQLSKIMRNSLSGWISAFSVTQIWLLMLGSQWGDLISCLHGAANLIFVLFLCKSSKQHLHLC